PNLSLYQKSAFSLSKDSVFHTGKLKRVAGLLGANLNSGFEGFCYQLHKPFEVYQKLTKLDCSWKTKKNYFTAINGLIEHNPPSELLKKFFEGLYPHYHHYTVLCDRHEVLEAQKTVQLKAFRSTGTIHLSRDKQWDVVLKLRDDMRQTHYHTDQKILLLSLLTLIPPMRDDWGSIHLGYSDTGNYYDATQHLIKLRDGKFSSQGPEI